MATGNIKREIKPLIIDAMAKESKSAPLPKGPEPSIKESLGFNRYRFTFPKIVMLLVATAMIVVGGFGLSSGSGTSPTASRSESSSPLTRSLNSNGNGLTQSFVESFPGPGGQQTGTAKAAIQEDRTILEQWSPSLVRGGFSMFIGFAIGYAIRAFLRLATVIIGGYFLVLTLMAWAGWVEIHWSVMEGQFDQMVSNLETQFASFKAFLMGSIPSAGLGAAGLASGLRQK